MSAYDDAIRAAVARMLEQREKWLDKSIGDLLVSGVAMTRIEVIEFMSDPGRTVIAVDNVPTHEWRGTFTTDGSGD